MAETATVLGRPDGPLFMGQMAAALQTGPWVEVADDDALRPKWFLFSFDLARNEAVFLDPGPEGDVVTAPFSYQILYDRAQQIIRLPLDRLQGLAARLAVAEPPVHLFNIGHCGSTLLHHVLNRSGAATCVSEPLFLFDLAMARATMAPERLVELIAAGCRLLQHSVAGRRLVIKHFSQSTTILPAFAAATPGARCVMLYRDAQSWANSVFGFAQHFGSTLAVRPDDREFLWWIMSGATPQQWLDRLVDMNAAEVTFDRLAAVAWALHLDGFRRAVTGGMRFQCLRYDALLADRAGSLQALFNGAGLEMVDLQAALAAFEVDSHAGTSTAKGMVVEKFGDREYANVAAVLAALPEPLSGQEDWGQVR